MEFEAMINRLSLKYNTKYGETYDLLLKAEIRLILKYPGKYLFKYENQREDAYKLIDRYLSIKQYKDYKLTGMES